MGKARLEFEAETEKITNTLSQWQSTHCACSALTLLFLGAVVLSLPLLSDHYEYTESRFSFRHRPIMSCLLLVLIGAFITLLSLGWFAYIPNSRNYAYGFCCIGIGAIWIGVDILFSRHGGNRVRVSQVKKLHPNSAVSLPRWVSIVTGWMISCIRAGYRLYRMLKKNFGMSSNKYMLRAMLFEILEVSLQMRSLLLSADKDDSLLLTIPKGAVIMLNCVVAPLSFYRRSKHMIIMCDAFCDVCYIILNSLHMIWGQRPVSLVAAVSAALPMLSLIHLISNYAHMVIRIKLYAKEEKMLVCRLPSMPEKVIWQKCQ